MAFGKATSVVAGTNGIEDGLWRQVMVSTMITLSRDLRIAVTAEGVESAAQLDVLEGMGCDSVQGYLLGVPMTAGEARAYIQRWAAARLAADAASADLRQAA